MQAIRGIIQSTYQLSNPSLVFDESSLNNLQKSLYAISGLTSDLSAVLMDD